MDKKKNAYTLVAALLLSWSLALVKIWLIPTNHGHFTHQVYFQLPELWKALVYYILPFKG